MPDPNPAQVHTIRLLPRSTLTDQVREFLLDRQARGLSKRTVAWYGEQLRHLLRYAEGLDDVAALTPAQIREMLVKHAESHNPGGVHALFRATHAFLSWYATENEVRNPIAKVSAPRVPEQTLDPVPIDTIRALLSTCTRRTFTGDRDAAMILALLDTGCRRSEFLALDVGDVNLETGAVQVRHGKGDKPRVTFIGARSKRAVMAYLKHRDPLADDRPLWVDDTGKRLTATALRAMLTRRAKQAGVQPPTPHMFRRGFAINTLRAGVDLVSIQRLLGHSDLSVLRRYLAQTEGDLQAAHGKAGPVDRLLK